MGIIRETGQMQLDCDKCGAEHPEVFPNDDFDEMIARAKEHGWRIVRDTGGWKHYCPKHQGAGAEFGVK